MTLSEMYVDQDVRIFEQRRDEVVALVERATDLSGADGGLCGIVESVRTATSEDEFDQAFDALVAAMCPTALS